LKNYTVRPSPFWMLKRIELETKNIVERVVMIE